MSPVAILIGSEIAFSLEERTGDTHFCSNETMDKLFKLAGYKWKVSGVSLTACGCIVTVKFRDLPGFSEVEVVRKKINSVLKEVK